MPMAHRRRIDEAFSPVATTIDSKKEEEQEGAKALKEREGRMTFTAHLGELRTRMIRSMVAVVVGFIACYVFSENLIEAISYPLKPLQGEKQVQESEDGEILTEYDDVIWITLNPLEPILVRLKIAAFGGLFFAFPYVLYQGCAFIFPGLTVRERRAVKMLLSGCTFLALGGSAVAYWGVFPLILPYLIQFAPDFVEVQLRLNETISLILKGIMGFAIAFQFPMVVVVLVYLGILTPETLKVYRKHAIICLFVVGALLTPPDPISLVLMAMPLVLLYEISIWLSYIVVRRKKKREEENA